MVKFLFTVPGMILAGGLALAVWWYGGQLIHSYNEGQIHQCVSEVQGETDKQQRAEINQLRQQLQVTQQRNNLLAQQNNQTKEQSRNMHLQIAQLSRDAEAARAKQIQGRPKSCPPCPGCLINDSIIDTINKPLRR